MGSNVSLTVIMPRVPGQNWSCHSCGDCCRTLVGHLYDEEKERIDRQGWAEQLGIEPTVRVGSGWVLNKRDDGACVFLDEDNRCRIHSRYGEHNKPLACRAFPYSVRAVQNGWQAALRFDCPSVIRSQGKPIEGQKSYVSAVANQLFHPGTPEPDTATLQRGLTAKPEEIDALTQRMTKWLTCEEVSLRHRFIGAARLTATLASANYESVRGQRFNELLDLLFTTLPGEGKQRPEPPSARQRAMLRQLAYAHTEHVTLQQLRAGVVGKMKIRLTQLRHARSFLRGKGQAQPLRGFDNTPTYEAIEGVANPDRADRDAIAELLQRYLHARFQGRSVFGKGYYGWPVFTGLAALWTALAVTGWLARYAAAGAGRERVTFDDVGRALGVVDRAASHAPALGTLAERTRVGYLLSDDGLARLVSAYVPV